MRVGIDARLLSEQITGIGRYTSELTRQLIMQKGEFHLYSACPISDNFWRQDNIMLRSGHFHNRIGKMLWSQTYLPYWSVKDQIDVFWGTTHRLPKYLPSSVARVVTIHDLVWKYAGETMRPLSRWMEKRLMPVAIRQADRIISDSLSTAQAIREEYPSVQERIRVIYPGVTDLPGPMEMHALSGFGIFQPYFLFVGTLEPRKNLKRLLRAFASLHRSIVGDAQLVIAGGKGWGSVNVNQLVKEMELSERVITVGYVTDVQLSTLYAHARFLVMPSLYEGFGLPLVEAMSFGIPVLTSNRSSLPEVCGDAGILVDPFDEESIATGLSTLLNDDDHRDKLASKAIRNAARFDWENAAIETLAVFEEAVQERGCSRGNS
ncbi:MAG: glycosyltransferase family 1 protein [Sedimenticola sp.]